MITDEALKNEFQGLPERDLNELFGMFSFYKRACEIKMLKIQVELGIRECHKIIAKNMMDYGMTEEEASHYSKDKGTPEEYLSKCRNAQKEV